MELWLFYFTTFVLICLILGVLLLCLRLTVIFFPLAQARSDQPVGNDRQGNVFTISDGQSAANAPARYHPDFFYIDSATDDLARIRNQIEKDDKDLPSYEEVMRITAMAEAQNAANAATTDSSGIRIAVPPYSEEDPNPLPALNRTEPSTPAPTANAAPTLEASTSRAAAEVGTETELHNRPGASIV